MATVTISDRLVPTNQYTQPTVGQTVTVNNTGTINLLIDPAGTLATLTVTMPATPTDGDTVSIGTSQIITALTMNGGTLVGPLTTMALGGFATYIFGGTAAKWFRVG